MKVRAALLILMLTVSLGGCLFSGFATANPAGELPHLSMPLEHVNYTLTQINGVPSAVIDGEYPISIQTSADCNFDDYLPMVYPMPPGTTNIHVYLDDAEVAYSNYTEAFPDALHQTALGDWWMIYAPLSVPDDAFTLKIHYEHPLQTLNGSYVFLYDLNISPYLTPEKPESTCIFTVRGVGNFSDLKVYTAPPNSVPSQWQPLDYTTTPDENGEVLTITMHSTYEQLVGEGLPGDLVVAFFAVDGIPEFPLWVVLAVFVVCLCGLFILKMQPLNRPRRRAHPLTGNA
jgi:hypothetical protein